MTNTVTRSLHDLGLAGWFGGTLANAVALNPAAAKAGSARSSGAVANAGWARWTPVNAVAISAHLVGGAAQLLQNKGRVVGQSGVATMSLVKAGLTVAALGVTGWSGVLGAKVYRQQDAPVQDGTTPLSTTPAAVASAQRQLKVLQWVIPALTGAIVVISALAGEQQRPSQVISGALSRIAD